MWKYVIAWCMVVLILQVQISRFTAVGVKAVKRWLRPVSYQNWPDQLLPEALQNANPLKIWRSIDGQLSKDAL